MAAQKNKEVDRSFAGLLIELILCAFCMLIGFLMLFVDSMKIEYFAYVIGGVLLAVGIYLILNFFVRHGYKEITNYDFSGGVLVTAIGVVVLINAKAFDLSFYLVLGIMLLILSVMIMQSTIQLLGMHGRAWWLNLIFALAILVYAILLLTWIKTKFLENEDLYYSLVIASGAIGIFSVIITAIRSAYFKKEEAEKAEKREDHDDYSVPFVQGIGNNINDTEAITEKPIDDEEPSEINEDSSEINENSAFESSSEQTNDVFSNIQNESENLDLNTEDIKSNDIPLSDSNSLDLEKESVNLSKEVSDADDSGFDEDELNLLREN